MTTANPADTYTSPGLPGHWHRTLELPCGYQHFNWLTEGEASPHGTYLNSAAHARGGLADCANDTLYLYTQHEIFYEEDVFKHTRSSPNWEGGLTTYATCKHLMRSYDVADWHGIWLAGLCPAHCAANSLLFVGRVHRAFASNYDLGEYVRGKPEVYAVKRASGNPRGDLYTPMGELTGADRYTHKNFVPPPRHTRSLEMYKKSPGSTSDRPDGRVPKWWRDIEYVQRGRRPPSFVLSPCYVFGRPMLWTSRRPRRAVLKMKAGEFLSSLKSSPLS